MLCPAPNNGYVVLHEPGTLFEEMIGIAMPPCKAVPSLSQYPINIRVVEVSTCAAIRSIRSGESPKVRGITSE